LLGELIAVRLSDVDELKQRAEAAKKSAKVDAAGDLADLAEAVALH
jgi:UDP-N-acetylglucosamine--N-acetylmuramyl-(pentapeptide) pyrophosphoryl-undecaprenol N-acetylglucosamine transferase